MDQDKTRMAFADGGLPVDPVSGNEVPPGSLPEEVRDDIPAQLSEGEYIVPADVLRYYGMKFFEDLRAEAKAALSGMEQDGRMGGEPMMEEPMEAEDDLPFSTEELLATDDMNEGGYMRGYAKGGITTPDQAAAAYPNTQMADIFGIGGNTGGIQYAVYYGPNGDTVTIQTFNGNPMSPVPSGYTTTPPVAAAKDVAPKTRGESDNNEKDQGQTGRTSYGDMTDQELDSALSATQGWQGRVGANMAATVGGLFAGTVGALAAREFAKNQQAKEQAAITAEIEARASKVDGISTTNDSTNLSSDNSGATGQATGEVSQGLGTPGQGPKGRSPDLGKSPSVGGSNFSASDQGTGQLGGGSAGGNQGMSSGDKDKSVGDRSKEAADKGRAKDGKSSTESAVDAGYDPGGEFNKGGLMTKKKKK